MSSLRLTIPGGAPVLALLSCLAAAPGMAGTLSIVHPFSGGADGATPYKGLTADGKGNFYGATFYGADDCPDSYQYAGVGCGTIYKIDSTGAFSTLVTFQGAANGASGESLTLQGSTLYGTAYTGGASNQGIVFSVKTSGAGFKILHTFAGMDGGHPNTFMRIDGSGNLFSETPYGGPGYTGTDFTGEGVLYEITRAHSFIAQHYFSGGADGGNPGRIVLDSSGTIYGTGQNGGSCSGTGLPSNGCGVIYQFVPSTGAFTTLYTFTGGNDGYAPQLGGIDKAGNLFGSTPYGGANNRGTLFELKKSGSSYIYATLWAFTGGTDGYEPLSPPALTGSDKLIGTTFFGPINGSATGAGTLFSFAKGKLTTLTTFINDAKGGYPEGTPVVGKGGVISGTTVYGGTTPCVTTNGNTISSYGCGVVYSYAP